jgi:2-methylcitrate dehydratase PrpD
MISTEDKNDAIFALARNIVGIRFEDIPREVREVTKRSILDILGVIIAGSELGEGCKEIVKLIKQMGGRKDSTILVYGDKVPCALAAFANSAMAHSLDYDDDHRQAAVHPTLATFPAALAVAEKVKGVTGKEFITGITLGNDLVCRLALAVTKGPRGNKLDWNMSSVVGVLGAAAVSAKLLNLDQNGMVNALAIAMQLASGTGEIAFSLGNKYRGLYGGPVAAGGVMSALLAREGITGPKQCLEGRAGLYNVHFNGLYRRESLMKELGKTFEGRNVDFKPWPSCGHTMNHIQAALRVMKRNNLRVSDIVQIIPIVGEQTRALCEPLELRQRPMSSLDAKWSIPWTIACAILRGKVTLNDFTPDGIKDTNTIELTHKITPEFQPQQSSDSYKVPPGIVQIKTKDGRIFSERVDYWHGAHQDPMTMDEIISKFRGCASYAAKTMSKKKILRIIDIVDSLEEIIEMTELINQFI